MRAICAERLQLEAGGEPCTGIDAWDAVEDSAGVQVPASMGLKS